MKELIESVFLEKGKQILQSEKVIEPVALFIYEDSADLLVLDDLYTDRAFLQSELLVKLLSNYPDSKGVLIIDTTSYFKDQCEQTAISYVWRSVDGQSGQYLYDYKKEGDQFTFGDVHDLPLKGIN